MAWVKAGLITPLKDVGGSGNQRVYSYHNLVEIGVIRELKEYGVNNLFVDAYLQELKKLDVTRDSNWALVGVKQHPSEPGNYVHDVARVRWSDMGEQALVGGPLPNTRVVGILSLIIVSIKDICTMVDSRL